MNNPNLSKPIFLGIDTGGTFTDFVMLSDTDMKVHKVLSSPSDPGNAILKGIEEMGLADLVKEGSIKIVHGTTVATNAVLQGKGVKTVYVTNKGFKDVLRIGRQARDTLYNLQPAPSKALAPDEFFLEVDCRMDSHGRVIKDLDAAIKDELKEKVRDLKPESVAINLLFSFLNDDHEKELEDLFKEDHFVSRSSFVLPEYKEFERGIATWINAWIGPLISQYLSTLRERLAPSHLSIMQSSGVTIEAGHAAKRAVNLLLSGPVAGVSASAFMGKRLNRTQLMSFDMGGTSTDVALYAGSMKLTDEGKVARFPIAIPMADIHTIGAGGGSIAFIDEGGLLQVGPRSAGADPGPACYGLEAKEPTVTDANLVLGRLLADEFLGGQLPLSSEASTRVLTPIADRLNLRHEEAAKGIISLANEHMVQALREISVQQGYDPSEFTLVSFGGAGGLHFCDLAEALDIKSVIVPHMAGVFSAFGMLVSPPGRELVKTRRHRLADISDLDIQVLLDELTKEGVLELSAEGCDPDTLRIAPALDLRYIGQTFTLKLPWTDKTLVSRAFHSLHESRYGHRLNHEIEMVNLRISITSPYQLQDAAGIDHQTINSDSLNTRKARRKTTMMYGYEKPIRVHYRSQIGAEQSVVGPSLVIEDHATHFIKEGWRGKLEESGNLVFSRN